MTTNLSRIIVLTCCPIFWGNYTYRKALSCPENKLNYFSTNNVNIGIGDNVTIDLLTVNYNNIIGGQVGLKFDTSKVLFKSIEWQNPFIANSVDVNLNNTEEGIIYFSWINNGLVPNSISDGAKLFSLEFTSKTTVLKLSEVLEFDATELNSEFYDSNFCPVFVQLEGAYWQGNSTFDSVSEDTELNRKKEATTENQNISIKKELLLCHPNPSEGEVSVLFRALTPSSNSYLQLIDIHGKVLLQETIQVKKGVNVFIPDLTSFNSGVYFVSLFHEGKVFTSRIVII